MNLDINAISNSFNQAIPDNWIGFSIDKVLEVCGIAPSTWRKYHKKIRDAEDYLKKHQQKHQQQLKQKPLGFTYKIRDGGLDRRSFFIIYCFCYLQKFFINENLALKNLYDHWEEIKCQVNL